MDNITVLGLLVLCVFIAVELRFIPSPFCRVAIKISSGKAEVTRGLLSGQSRAFIEDVLKPYGKINGFVTLSGTCTVRFSYRIPETAHQQIRNILLN